jgi:hypothetical protein
MTDKYKITRDGVEFASKDWYAAGLRKLARAWRKRGLSNADIAYQLQIAVAKTLAGFALSYSIPPENAKEFLEFMHANAGDIRAAWAILAPEVLRELDI